MLTYYEHFDFLDESNMMEDAASGRPYGASRMKFGAIVVPIHGTDILYGGCLDTIYSRYRDFKNELMNTFRRKNFIECGKYNVVRAQIGRPFWSTLRLVTIAVDENVNDIPQYEHMDKGFRFVVERMNEIVYNSGERLIIPMEPFCRGLDFKIVHDIVKNAFLGVSRDILVVLPPDVRISDVSDVRDAGVTSRRPVS